MRLYPLHSLFNLAGLKKEKYQKVTNNTKSALLLHINNTRFMKRNSLYHFWRPLPATSMHRPEICNVFERYVYRILVSMHFDVWHSTYRCLPWTIIAAVGFARKYPDNVVYCDICRHYTTPFTNLCLCARNCRRCMIVFINICYIAS